ncbi:MAG: TIGR02147 family protein [Fibrobacteria bacterium]|nr:TIGR02147 family protein [Fibrobacteria bacterium]
MSTKADHADALPPPVVFAFLDHREFLRRWYEWKKSSSRGFSYRSFARKAGFSSMSFLRDVIEGRRNISDDSVEKFLSAIGLVEDAALYFRELVRYNRETDLDKRTQWFRKLLLLQARREFSPVRENQVKYYSDWLNVVVREAASLERFQGDATKIAQAIRPRVPAVEVSDALDLLVRIEMLEKTADGGYRPLTPRIVPGDIDPAMVRNIKRQMLLHALDRLDAPLDPDTHISSVTLTVSQARLARLQESIRQFRLDLLADTASDEGSLEQVVQVNFQVLPFLRAVDRDPS